MIKLLILGDASSPHIQRWIEGYSKDKYELHIISFQKAIIDDVNFNHISIPKFLTIASVVPLWRKIGYIFTIYDIWKHVKKISPDILHVHWGTSYGFLGALLGYSPLIISVWGSDILYSPQKSFIMRLVIRYNLFKADLITATSKVLKEETSKYVSNKKKIFYIPFGIDTSVFFPLLKNKNQKSYVNIGTVKSLEKKYGLDYLIQAFAIIIDSGYDVRLTIVGSGSIYSELKLMVYKLNLTDYVTFVGNVSNYDVVEYLQFMDIFVLPSLYESFGVAAVEASACGLPVVSSNVGGVSEVVIDGETGFLIDAGDVEQLVDKICVLIDNPDLRNDMGAKGRRFINSNYTIQKSINDMEKIYNKYL